jgi:sporulation protein YlmC with PRC-barrel domain
MPILAGGKGEAMSVIGTRDLIGKSVVSQDGAEIGDIQALDIDVETWKVVTVEIRLERGVLEKLNLKKPLLGSQSVRIAAERISGVSDQVVLKNTVDQIAFIDKPDDSSQDESSSKEPKA